MRSKGPRGSDELSVGARGERKKQTPDVIPSALVLEFVSVGSCRSIPWLAAAAMDVWDVGERGNEMGWPMLGTRSRRLLVTDKVMIE